MSVHIAKRIPAFAETRKKQQRAPQGVAGEGEGSQLPQQHEHGSTLPRYRRFVPQAGAVKRPNLSAGRGESPLRKRTRHLVEAALGGVRFWTVGAGERLPAGKRGHTGQQRTPPLPENAKRFVEEATAAAETRLFVEDVIRGRFWGNFQKFSPVHNAICDVISCET